MIAVIFEAEPKSGRAAEYFETAAALRESVERVDGFVSIERFESVTKSGKYLSLSYWRDEEAVRSWRENASHRAAQEFGRAHLFANYRIRVATVIRDYGQDTAVRG